MWRLAAWPGDCSLACCIVGVPLAVVARLHAVVRAVGLLVSLAVRAGPCLSRVVRCRFRLHMGGWLRHRGRHWLVAAVSGSGSLSRPFCMPWFAAVGLSFCLACLARSVPHGSCPAAVVAFTRGFGSHCLLYRVRLGLVRHLFGVRGGRLEGGGRSGRWRGEVVGEVGGSAGARRFGGLLFA